MHLQILAIRAVVQESLGFSPSELVFAHTVPGPLKELSQHWLCKQTEKNVWDYVTDVTLKL